MRRPVFGALIAGAVITTALAAPATATAQSSGSSDELLRGLIVGSSADPGSSGSSLNTLLSSMSLLGSSEVPLSGPLLSSEDGYPLATDPSIETPAIVDKQVEDPGLRLERWTVASPSMQRNVEVQIMTSADPDAPAPMLYLLDGIGGSKSSSGWINQGEGPKVFAEENVTVVMPLGAAASMYSDWLEEDPALGRIMWETFITQELAPLLEAEDELNFNGHRGIGGLSMGATGAVHLANSNPKFFDAVMGISGCYSTTDPIGRQTVSLIVNSRGGDTENMWGPFGSETWREHDVVSNPEGLSEMAVYLSAANGSLTEADIADYADEPFYNMLAGTVLERGVLACTRDLDEAMRDAGMDHQVIDYKGPGVHNWRNYNEQLQPGWDAVKHALV